MTDQRLTQKGSIPDIADGDVLYIVDVSDSTDSAQGSSKKVTAAAIKTYTGGGSGDLKADGTVPMTGNLDLGGNDVDNAGDVAATTLTLNGVLVSVNPVSGNNIAKTYATAATMIAATDLVVGQTAITQGYDVAGDGYGAEYIIVAAATGTADADTFITLTGITGQAQRITEYEKSRDRKSKILGLFGNAKRDICVYGAFWNTTPGVEPWLFSHIGGGKYLKVPLRAEGGAGYSVDTMGEMHIMGIYQSSGPDTGSITVTLTGTWTTGVASTPAFDGQYAYTSTTADYYEWTTPAKTTMVGQRGNHLADGGLCKVEIDGDATLATNLPTAQDLVDAGTIAALGTLSATDRILDCNELDDYDYDGMSGNADVMVMFADNLTAGVHTVRVTVTGEKATASTGYRLYYSGVCYRTEDTQLNSDNVFGMGSNDFNGIGNQHGGGFYYVDRISPVTNSVTEYAFHLLPTGATDQTTWIGNGHGYEEQTGMTFYVDGVARTLTGQTYYIGDEVSVVRTSEIFHPDIGAGATAIANATVEYRVEQYGIRVTTEIDWLSDGTGEGGYIHMFPLDNSLDKANSTYLRGADVGLNAEDGTFHLNSRSDLIYAWQDTGEYAAALYVEDLHASSDNYRYCDPDGQMSIQDRTTGSMQKIYVSRGDNSVPITNGDKWLASVQYLVGRFTPEANRNFARP